MDGGALFLLRSTFTGAAAAASVLGTGVAFASDFVSAEAGEGCWTTGAGGASSFATTGGVWKRANIVDGKGSVTTRLFFALPVGVDDIVVDVVVWMICS